MLERLSDRSRITSAVRIEFSSSFPKGLNDSNALAEELWPMIVPQLECQARYSSSHQSAPLNHSHSEYVKHYAISVGKTEEANLYARKSEARPPFRSESIGH